MDFKTLLSEKLSKIKLNLKESTVEIPVDERSPEAIAKKHNVPVEDIQNEIELGTKHEQKEHGDIAQKIATDHVIEHPKYYSDKKYGINVVDRELDEVVDANALKAAKIKAANAEADYATKNAQVAQQQANDAKKQASTPALAKPVMETKILNPEHASDKTQYFKEAWKRVVK